MVPLFVVGCGRSGSTLLRLMLDAHPALAVPGESHFIPQLWRDFGGSRPVDAEAIAVALVSTTHFGHWKVDPRAVLDRVAQLQAPSFADVVEAAFMANADAHGKTGWGDKTPIYVRSIPLLASLWPDSRFVHLIRDGRDVALSYMSLHWGPSTVWAAARKWRGDVEAGIRDGQPLGTSRYLEVRYESLVTDVRASLQEICDFASLGLDEGMIERTKREGHETLAPEEGRAFHARSEQDVLTGARDWTTQMTARDVRSFEAVAGPLLSDFGYERRFPEVALRERLEGLARTRAMDLFTSGANAKKALTRKLAR